MQRLLLGNKDISTSLKFDNEFSVVAFPIYEDSIELEYLVVGGGGSGAVRGNIVTEAGGGGGAGQVQTGSISFATGSDPMVLSVGLGGNGQTYDGTGGDGLDGYNSRLGIQENPTVLASGGEGGFPIGDAIRPEETGGRSGGGLNGGFNGFYDNDAGGGAGARTIGGSGLQGEGDTTANGGAGGNGVNVSDWYWNSSLDVVGVIAGGGGGSAGDSASPVAGLGSDGGGNGAIGSNNGNDATTFGSGGGGCEEGDDSIYPKGGDGHDGLVVLRYQNKFKINDSGDDVFQVGDYWYHSFYASASLILSYAS